MRSSYLEYELPPVPRDESPLLLDVYDDMNGILVFFLSNSLVVLSSWSYHLCGHSDLSIWSITLQLFSWSEKKPSYLLVLCVSAARFLLLLNGEMNEWLFCCKCLYLLFSLWEMIKSVL